MVKKLLLLSLLLVPTVGLAQTPAEVNLKVSISNAEKIWKGLRKLPVEEVEELLIDIRQQVATQTQPKPVAPSTEEKKDVPAPPNAPN